MSHLNIAVVMSTYNGERYVEEQLESVFEQQLPNGVNLDVVVRDDGSTDETLSILRGYAQKGRIELHEGRNVGVCASFLDLLEGLPLRYDYVALCDQDDVWHADKLLRAVSVLDRFGQTTPQLYCSEYIFCDSGLTPIGKSQLNKSGVTFEKMLYENVCSGNTMVMNRALHDVIRSLGHEGVYCHDWWLALIATALGELHYDTTFFSLDYRRIGSNASPTGSGFLKLLRYRIAKFVKAGELELVVHQLQALWLGVGEKLDRAKADTLNRFLSDKRMCKAMMPIRLRQTISGELMLRILFLLGRL